MCEIKCNKCGKVEKSNYPWLEMGKKPACNSCEIVENNARIAKRREYHKRYKLANKVAYDAQQVKYREDNREKARLYASEYRKRVGENTKTCNTCMLTKQLTEFSKSATGTLGRSGKCKECVSIYREERSRLG